MLDLVFLPVGMACWVGAGENGVLDGVAGTAGAQVSLNLTRRFVGTGHVLSGVLGQRSDLVQRGPEFVCFHWAPIYLSDYSMIFRNLLP